MPVEQAGTGGSADGGQLFAGYETDPAFYDEMFDAAGAPRAHCRELWEVLGETPRDEIAIMQERAERSFPARRHHLFRLRRRRRAGTDHPDRYHPAGDCGPAEWDLIERGLHQRLEALNLFLADIYGPGRIIADGVIPAEMVRGCPQFRIAMRGVEVAHSTYVSVCGTDLVRTHDGFLVLEDNLRVPSGVSYMLANRAAV